MAKKNSGFIGGLAAGIAATILAGTAFTEYWLYGESRPNNLQPTTGVIQLVETPATAEPLAATQAESEPTSTPNPFVPGRTATTRNNLRIYADADRSSIVLNQLAQGETVTLIEASGNYESYPVVLGEQSWVRIRSEDGLVGWAETANLAAK